MKTDACLQRLLLLLPCHTKVGLTAAHCMNIDSTHTNTPSSGRSLHVPDMVDAPEHEPPCLTVSRGAAVAGRCNALTYTSYHGSACCTQQQSDMHNSARPQETNMQLAGQEHIWPECTLLLLIMLRQPYQSPWAFNSGDDITTTTAVPCTALHAPCRWQSVCKVCDKHAARAQPQNTKPTTYTLSSKQTCRGLALTCS